MSRRSRYVGIMRGLRGQAAKVQLREWLEGDRVVTYPERQGDRPPARLIYVNPHNLPTAAAARLEQKVNSDRWDSVKAFVNGLVDEAAPAAAENIIIAPRLRAPAALIRLDVANVGTNRVSKLTGLTYKDYGGDAAVVPYGMGATADTPSEGFALIRSRVKTASRRNQVTYRAGNYAF